jgi:hypothetical protein
MEIEVPRYGHLDFSGNGWACNRGYQRLDDQCIEPAPTELANSTPEAS